ncbi:hypothetical protein Aglo03_57300 [Actinokineospora globicatena]|uniref:Uncharacterized protein n=1 Tax=Actinokineospora globicatena TaxID=103729 RepID=A0A9W6QUN9_9PSEU|nr:hypothetical protein Aglo03_57300 [Actinokineospora globicatena]
MSVHAGLFVGRLGAVGRGVNPAGRCQPLSATDDSASMLLISTISYIDNGLWVARVWERYEHGRGIANYT